MKEDPFVPEVFGRNQKGMQPGEELDSDTASDCRARWLANAGHALGEAAWLAEQGVHKQYANRLLEPFSWHQAVITATDTDNFFHLRVNPMAQGELRKAAELMQKTRAKSEPRSCEGEWGWHTPYVEHDELIHLRMTGCDVAAVSAARCARVSYLTQNGARDVAEDLALYARLVESGHMSPLEHTARPMEKHELSFTRTFEVSLNHGPMLRTGTWNGPTGTTPMVGSMVFLGGDSEKTITAVRGPLHYSGKLNGWISRRAHVPGEHDILGHRAST